MNYLRNGGKSAVATFAMTGGLLSKVIDYWPEPYEPPPRQTLHMKRSPE